MVILNRFIKFFWFISILIFLVALFAAYYYWPAIVDVKLNRAVYGSEDLYITKETVFYYAVGFFTIINLIMTILSSTLGKLPVGLIKVPNSSYWTESIEKVKITRILLKNWITVYNTLVNILTTAFIFALMVINYQDETTHSRNFEWLLPFSFVILIAGIIYPFIRFNIKKHGQFDDGYFRS